MEDNKILKFLRFTLKFRDIERTIEIPGKNPKENDVEHSYQLAMFAWYLVESRNLPLDINMVIKYALVHDMVEVYAGDVDTFSTDVKLLEGKEVRENEAQEKISTEFGEFPELHEFIGGYQEKRNEEAKFVYALDKIVSELDVALDDNRWNVKRGVTLEMLEEKKGSKIAHSVYVQKIWEELLPWRREVELKSFSKK